MNLDNIITKTKSLHLIGIGGCGMSALAKIFNESGYKISGSDIKESINTIRLRDSGIKIFFEHHPFNIREADVIVLSSAIPDSNCELQEAKSKKLPILKRAQVLSWLMDQAKIAVAVAGTHGKTTTTSMISLIFEKCGLNPTFLIGGEVHDIGGNAKLGNGKYFVAEADESDGSFLELNPKISVVTNIEADHLDFFKDFQTVKDVFGQYIDKLPDDGLLVMNSDHPVNQEILNKINKKYLLYGLNEKAKFKAADIYFKEVSSHFSLLKENEKIGEVELHVPGEHNVLNALAAFACGFYLGLDFKDMAAALKSFTGARRRFQFIGQGKNVLVFDDYAHHPTEIKATLSAAKQGWQRRIICVFQPHRYTRTMFLYKEFGESFFDSDEVIITDIYSADEEPLPGVNSKLIVDEIAKQGQPLATYIPRKEKVADYVMERFKEGDLFITMGAGDIYTVAKEVFSRLKIKKKINA